MEMDESFFDNELESLSRQHQRLLETLTPGRPGRTQRRDEDEDNDDEGAMGEPAQPSASTVSDATKKRLQKLGKIFNEGDEGELESPLPPSRGREILEKENLLPELRPQPLDEPYDSGRSRRLAQLASIVRDREDDVEHLGHHEYRTFTEGSPQKQAAVKKPPRKSMTPASPSKFSTSAAPTGDVGQRVENPVGGRKIDWDPKVIDKLESQGFKKTASQSRLQYEFEQEQRRKMIEAAAAERQATSSSSPVVHATSSEPAESIPGPSGVSVTSIAKRFGATDSVPVPPPLPKATVSKSAQTSHGFKSQAAPQVVQVPKPPQAASTFLPSAPPPPPEAQAPGGPKSVLDMIKNFEGKGEAKEPIPQVDPAVLPVSQKLKMFEKEQKRQAALAGGKPPPPKPLKNTGPPKPPRDPVSLGSTAATVAAMASGPLRPTAPVPAPAPALVAAEPEPALPTVASGPNTVMAQRMLFENVEDGWKTNDIAKKTFEQKRRDMEVLMNRFNKPVEVCVAEPRATVATENAVPGWQKVIHPEARIIPMCPTGVPPPPPPPPPPGANMNVAGPSRAFYRPPIQAPAAVPSETSEDTYATAPTSSSEAESDQQEQEKRWRVRFQGGGLYPSLADVEVDNDVTADETGMESDTEQSESQMETEDESVLNAGPSMIRQVSYHMAVHTHRGDMTETETESETYSEWDRESVGSSVTTTGGEYDLRRMNTEEDLTSLSSYRSSPPKRSHEPSPPRDVVKRVRLMDPRTEHLEQESPNQPSLRYTVSTYRRQKPEILTTPTAKKITYQYHTPTVEESPEPESPNTMKKQAAVTKKGMAIRIRELESELVTQLSIMHQTSNAVNLCSTRPEFKSSNERIEGEKLLLISTKRHAAIYEEIHRLKAEVEKPESEIAVKCGTKGTVTISGLSLHLKSDFVEVLLENNDDWVHHFLILVKHRENVIPSQLISVNTIGVVKQGCIVFDNQIVLRDLDEDFVINIEVYALQTKRDRIEHDVKYHIKKSEKSKLRLTPKRSHHHDKDAMKTPPAVNVGASPAVGAFGGTPAIRKLCFGLVGESSVTLATARSTKLTLAKVPPLSPLSGILMLNVHCASQSTIETSGFLTVFEEVSGLGCWQRRWYLLKGSILSYWKYPDQQTKNEPPMGSIDLTECINDEFRALRRDLCARLNTFALVIMKPHEPNHKDNLVMFRRGEVTLIRYMLAADSKEEMRGWCRQLMKALEDVRAWNPDAKQALPSECEILNGA